MTWTWLFKNDHKLCFMKYEESGVTGYVIDTGTYPCIRHATKEDMVTNQYTEAELIERKGGI